ncbi:GmrSD restriction endonuclease domain-containing protein [Candidatus Palauibacter sp.]|uniref:GmrSD restriction endonuclease domain-containing protein n=1 Tax=Candidatus Palauibacter sp. TaxID=3101350 RepID=UPI003B013342
MKDAQTPDHVSLTTIVRWLNEGRFVIPDFQRDFEWKPWDINALMRSIFRDYFIGSLLLWKGRSKNFAALACEPVYGYAPDRAVPEHIVLDGQQRLTAMYYTFTAPDVPLPSRKNRYLYFIRVDKFMTDSDEDAFCYYWTRFGPKVLATPSEQYERHLFPLAIIGRGGWGLFEWLKEYEEYWNKQQEDVQAAGDTSASTAASKHAAAAQAFSDHMRAITQEYQVSFIELDRDLAVDKVCDIFTQINSTGAPLDVFDLINALLKPKGLQLKHMWREAKGRLQFVETPKMNVYILQVMSILCQAYCSPKYLYYLLPGQERQIRDDEGARKVILVADIDDFENRWNVAVEALESAITLLKDPREFGAISSRFLPYISILPVFASLQAHVNELPPEEKLAAQAKIRQWYWASVFVNRYSGAVESTSARDFLDVKRWIADPGEVPALIEEFKGRLLGLDLRRETRGGTSVYKGIFNLLILRGARDWMTGKAPQHGSLDDHHVVPKAWGRANLKGEEADTILNRTPLSDETNRHVINNQLPNRYLPELIENNGREAVEEMLASHLVSPQALAILLRDPFTADDFREFLDERERAVRQAIEDVLLQSRIDLPGDLRVLDEGIQEVEIGIRNLIETKLEGDRDAVPQHIQRKVDERLDRAIKKNAVLDAEHYESFRGQLEFFDLRELQDTIVNRHLWPRFEEVFGSKGTLERRFDQVADARNGIRHSRWVDDVTEKEGEAAVLWFQTVMGRESA